MGAMGNAQSGQRHSWRAGVLLSMGPSGRPWKLGQVREKSAQSEREGLLSRGDCHARPRAGVWLSRGAELRRDEGSGSCWGGMNKPL